MVNVLLRSGPAAARYAPGAAASALFGAVPGAVIKRPMGEVERTIGRDALIREVRSRGFHLIACGQEYIIICNPAALRVIT